MTLEDAVVRLRERTEHQLERAEKLQLTFSQNITELLHTFTPQTKNIYKEQIRDVSVSFSLPNSIQPITISPSISIFYLGVASNESLAFTIHSKIAVCKGYQALGRLRFLRKQSWGMPSITAQHLVFSDIVPKML